MPPTILSDTIEALINISMYPPVRKILKEKIDLMLEIISPSTSTQPRLQNYDIPRINAIFEGARNEAYEMEEKSGEGEINEV